MCTNMSSTVLTITDQRFSKVICASVCFQAPPPFSFHQNLPISVTHTQDGQMWSWAAQDHAELFYWKDSQDPVGGQADHWPLNKWRHAHTLHLPCTSWPSWDPAEGDRRLTPRVLAPHFFHLFNLINVTRSWNVLFIGQPMWYAKQIQTGSFP